MILTDVGRIHENAKHDPLNPRTVRAYQAFTSEVWSQFEDMLAGGLVVEFSSEDAYGSSNEMRSDVFDRNHLSVFTAADLPANHPLAQLAPNGEMFNSVFRAVHDLYGHAGTGYGFGPQGELKAFRAHAVYFTPEALPALAAETLAQNAWVNFGPHNPQNLRTSERPFAPQKAYAFPLSVALEFAS